MKVVIIGGGFGGLRLARKLNNKPGFEVVLIDRVNYHQFQPLLYQVATAALDASNISFPLRKVFHKSKNVRIRLAELKEIIAPQNKIITSTEEITYDILVLATGTETNFFGNQQLIDYAFPMKSTVEALQIRHKLIRNFEEALLVKDPDELQRLMNIVVVGGGPTGVELSGALAEMKNYVLHKDYPELDFSKMNIFLLEGGPKTLGNMSERSSEDSSRNLQKLQQGETKFDEFEYYDKGTMATVGRNLAVVDIPKPKLHFHGFIAWMIWMSLHLVLILGVKNRFFVFSNWVYNYFTHDQSLRLIFPEFYKAKKK